MLRFSPEGFKENPESDFPKTYAGSRECQNFLRFFGLSRPIREHGPFLRRLGLIVAWSNLDRGISYPQGFGRLEQECFLEGESGEPQVFGFDSLAEQPENPQGRPEGFDLLGAHPPACSPCFRTRSGDLLKPGLYLRPRNFQPGNRHELVLGFLSKDAPQPLGVASGQHQAFCRSDGVGLEYLHGFMKARFQLRDLRGPLPA